MRKFIESKILHINKATGLEIIFQTDDMLLIHSFTGSSRKNSITKEGLVSGIAELNNLPGKITTAIPVSVVFNGKGVLTKKMPPGYSKDNPLAAVLPGANPADFYYDLYEFPGFASISVIRKQAVDNIIAGLRELGFKVLSVSFGFHAIAPVLSFLNQGAAQETDTGSFIITTDSKNQVLDFKPKNDSGNDLSAQPEYEIAGQYIKANHLLSFAAAVNLLADDINLPAAVPAPLITEQRSDYKYYRYFRFAGLALLMVLFAVLLSSFFVYNHYFTLNRERQSSRLLNDQQERKIRQKETEIQQKERFLSRTGWINRSRTSYYADRIAGLTPTDVLLTNMNVYPLSTSLTDEKGITWKKDTIEVSGICYDPVVLNQFISGLKIIPDFSNVTVKNYQYRKENEAGAFLMEIITK